MSNLIGSLRVTLGIDTAAYSDGLSKAETLTKRSMGQIKSAIGGLAAGVGLSVFTALAGRALDYASSLGETAQQLGVTTKELQEYRYVASQVGVEQEAMDKSLAKLTRTIGQAATGGKQQSAVFKALGIDIQDANGKIRTAGDILPELADALAKIPDPARRAAVETQLFGKAGQQLDTMLAGGSKAMNELRQAAHDLGIVLSEDEIQRADETADKLAEVKMVLEANIAGTVANNAQSILGLADAMGQLTAAVVKFLGADPARAAALIGVIAGGSIAGARGALVGGLGGYIAGGRVRMAKTDAVLARGQLERKLANRYLDGRSDLSSAARTRAKQQVGEMINQRLGIVIEESAFGTKRSRVIEPKQAEAPAAVTTGVPTDIDLDNLSGGGGGGGSKKTPRAKGSGPSVSDIERRFNDQLAGYAQQALSAMQDLAKTTEERAELELRSVELAHTRTIADIDADKNYSAVQKERLRQQVDVLAELERERVEFDRKAATEREIADLADARFEVERDALNGQYDLARTADERRSLAEQMLELEYRHKEAILKAIIASETAATVDKQRAQVALDALPGQRAVAGEKARRDTAGPLESFFESIPQTAAQANEAMEAVATGGLQSIIDGLAGAATGAKNLGSIFSDVARQIVADLIRIQIRKAIVSGLSSLLGGGGSALTPKPILDSDFMPVSLPGFARGGVLSVGGRPGVDTNLLSINGVPRARVSADEHIAVIPNNAGGGRTEVVIVPSPYFDARVDGRAASVAAPMAMASGHYARSAAQGDITRKARRRIPG